MLADTMNQVKAAEQQAADIVQNAKERAAALAEDARNRAKMKIEDARNRAEADARDALARARQEGEEEKENYASKVSNELDLSMERALSRSDEAVDAILAGLV